MSTPDLYVFKYHAVDRDDDGYYVTRWDRARAYEVVAESRAEALTKLWALLGDASRGRHWMARLQSARDIRIPAETKG